MILLLLSHVEDDETIIMEQIYVPQGMVSVMTASVVSESYARLCIHA